MLTIVRNGQLLHSTRVVLPHSAQAYRLPVHGVVQQAIWKPSWTPTAATRKAQPRLKAYYRGGESGNAMGDIKLVIQYEAGSNIPSTVRIHGAAAEVDLGTRKSRGCIRVQNSFAPTLLQAVNEGQRLGVVRTYFYN